MLKMRLGAVPLTDVKMPNPLLPQTGRPIWEDRVVVAGPRQPLVGEGRIGCCEPGIAVGASFTDVKSGVEG